MSLHLLTPTVCYLAWTPSSSQKAKPGYVQTRPCTHSKVEHDSAPTYDPCLTPPPSLHVQATTDPAVFQVALSGVSVLVKRVTATSPESQQHQLDSQQLSPLLHALLCFSTSEPTLQAMVLRVVAHCLVHANSSCSQHRPSLKKWASASTFHSYLPLAQVW